MSGKSSAFTFAAVLVAFSVIGIAANGFGIGRWIPNWLTLAIILTAIGLERFSTVGARYAHRRFMTRDVFASAVNLFIAGPVGSTLFLSGFAVLSTVLLDRTRWFETAELGPFWLQVAIALLGFSFLRYWLHRLQHNVSWLWRFHAVHHNVRALRASNTLVTHPIDFAVRNALPITVLVVIGFDGFAIVAAITAMKVSASFGHCSADIRAGALNRWIVTPEVHRWHHSADVPAGHRFAVNFGVGTVIWDRLFGTFYLPVGDDGLPVHPARIGNGREPDEPSFLRFLVAPFSRDKRLDATGPVAD